MLTKIMEYVTCILKRSDTQIQLLVNEFVTFPCTNIQSDSTFIFL